MTSPSLSIADRRVGACCWGKGQAAPEGFLVRRVVPRGQWDAVCGARSHWLTILSQSELTAITVLCAVTVSGERAKLCLLVTSSNVHVPAPRRAPGSLSSACRPFSCAPALSVVSSEGTTCSPVIHGPHTGPGPGSAEVDKRWIEAQRRGLTWGRGTGLQQRDTGGQRGAWGRGKGT